MAAGVYIHRKTEKKRKRRKDIRRYISVLPKEKKFQRNDRQAKEEEEDKKCSYISALSLSTGVRRKREIKDEEDPTESLMSLKDKTSQNIAQLQNPPAKTIIESENTIKKPATEKSPNSPPSPTVDATLESSCTDKENDNFQDDSPVILSESELLSQETLLALLHCNTQQMLEQL